MSRTKPHQLDLMTIPTLATALPPDAKAFEDAQRQIAALKRDLDIETRRAVDLAAAHVALSLENAALKADLAAARRSAGAADVESLKRDLIKLAHPDKWSQGQLATELAHEITVRLTTGKKTRR
jgi:hypothetical protein